MSTALDYRKQNLLNKPSRAFGKALKVYGSRMKQAKSAHIKPQAVTTDFDELISLQKSRAEQHRRSYDRFLGFLGMGIFIFLGFYLVYALDLFSSSWIH